MLWKVCCLYNTALQSQKAVYASFTSKQIQPFGFAGQDTVTYFKNKFSFFKLYSDINHVNMQVSMDCIRAEAKVEKGARPDGPAKISKKPTFL